jgi:hypothetical protein
MISVTLDDAIAMAEFLLAKTAFPESRMLLCFEVCVVLSKVACTDGCVSQAQVQNAINAAVGAGSDCRLANLLALVTGSRKSQSTRLPECHARVQGLLELNTTSRLVFLSP